MKKTVFKYIKHVGKVLLIAMAGVLVTILVVAVMFLNRKPELSVWHTVNLDEEFTTDSKVKTLEDYLALEDKLFQQLDDKVYDKVPSGKHSDISRYTKGSLSDPNAWLRNWNRTFELPTETPQAGVLLLHGMSDSPYSLHQLGQSLNAHGAWVVGLRIPGHGTAPSGLTRATWEDMAGATALAARHLRKVVGDKPIYIVGYSNGGALAVNYTLAAVASDDLPKPAGVILISPSIGVTPAASMAVWQSRLGRLLGMEKLAWTSVIPEYDPYKYGSFAVNAGIQVYRLTQEIQSQIDSLNEAGKLEQVPPILAFQSALDATVSIDALVTDLFDRLPAVGHELVIFDLNRMTDVLHLLKNDPKPRLKAMLTKPDQAFIVTVLTNEEKNSQQIMARQRFPGQPTLKQTPLNFSWPEDVYSLAHVALPFSVDDPLYGREDDPKSKHVQLGNLGLRGERNSLRVSPSDMLRLRWNPFYPYLEDRLIKFVGLNQTSKIQPVKK